MTPSASSYGILKSSIKEDLNAFTLCYRIKPYFFRPEVIVLSYVVVKRPLFLPLPLPSPSLLLLLFPPSPPSSFSFPPLPPPPSLSLPLPSSLFLPSLLLLLLLPSPSRLLSPPSLPHPSSPTYTTFTPPLSPSSLSPPPYLHNLQPPLSPPPISPSLLPNTTHTLHPSPPPLICHPALPDHNRRGMQLMMALQRLRQVTEAVTPLMFWSAWCYGVDSATGEWKIYMNGEKIADGRWLPVSKVRSGRVSGSFLPKNGTLVIGQDQDTEGSGFDATQSFCGEFTGLEIFDRMLDEFDLKDLSSCESTLKGNILTWEDAEYQQLSQSCDVKPVPFFMFLDKLQFSASTFLCSALGGSVATPMNADEQETLYTLSSKNADLCAADGGALMWLGITDEDSEKEWYYYDTKEPVQFLLWTQGQPNGGVLENCAVMKGGLPGHVGGQRVQEVVQVLPRVPRGHPRVPAVPRDLRLQPVRRPLHPGRPQEQQAVLPGILQVARLLHDSGTGSWRILENNTFAIMEESGPSTSPSAGQLAVSHGFCGKKAGELLSLALTQCSKNEEFTCNNGNCIPLDQVCDRRAQCEDNSSATCSLPYNYIQPQHPHSDLTQPHPLPKPPTLRNTSHPSLLSDNDEDTYYPLEYHTNRETLPLASCSKLIPSSPEKGLHYKALNLSRHSPLYTSRHITRHSTSINDPMDATTNQHNTTQLLH
ncbi:putative neuronal pentraxin-2 [Penaeus vannamei]|uniref:Putative neuronal pentraxin-2 n=1 Tax=Penaeus vannamei TaxID=6689 RepID=A0A423TZU2_PENVA|nr:putative neuronal pentraxin-2 [Penaeus vannamei]